MSETWQRAKAHIEAALGGSVVDYQRQDRWRDAWYFDLDRGGQRLPLYFRGHRPGMQSSIYPHEHEARVLRLLEDHGVAVPHLHAVIPEPGGGLVLDRMPGRPNLATAESDEEARSVLEQYIRQLAAIHAIPRAAVEAAGFPVPDTAEGLARGDLDAWEKPYLAQKRRPEPVVELLRVWLREHVPQRASRPVFLHGDAGQFLFDQGELTAVIDLEFAYAGDRAGDWGALLSRDISEPLGDLRPMLPLYEGLMGEKLDLDAVDYHTVRFYMVTPMSIAALVAAPPAGINLMQYLSWYWVYARIPLELVARRAGVTLEPPSFPPAADTRHAAVHRSLVSSLEQRIEASRDPIERYELGSALRMAWHAQRVEALGPAVEAEDLADAGQLLGRRPASWQQADAELEALALRGDPAALPGLLRVLHRRCLRSEFLIGKDALRELAGAQLQLLREA